MKKLILASQSPRRTSLLKDAGFSFTCHPANISEIPNKNLNVDEQILDIARRKAEAVCHEYMNSESVILAADTEVVLGSQTLGKPSSIESAQEMIRSLSGRTHWVKTALVIIDVLTKKTVTHIETTEITFRDLTDTEIKNYVATGESLDKAGAYGIQGHGKGLVKKVVGSFDNVVGLPVSVVSHLLQSEFMISSSLVKILNEVEPTQIVAVSKKKTAEDIRKLYLRGYRQFGENYVQEAIEKQTALADLKDISWHFIGHLQTNKVKNIIGQFDLIHSVDSEHLLRKINNECQKKSLTQKVLLQIMLIPEENKFGFTLDEVQQILAEEQSYPFVQIRGLMLMPPPDIGWTELRGLFKETSTFAKKNMNIPEPILSMGTSHDFHIALSEGATLVRIGTLLFGSRS